MGKERSITSSHAHTQMHTWDVCIVTTYNLFALIKTERYFAMVSTRRSISDTKYAYNIFVLYIKTYTYVCISFLYLEHEHGAHIRTHTHARKSYTNRFCCFFFYIIWKWILINSIVITSISIDHWPIVFFFLLRDIYTELNVNQNTRKIYNRIVCGWRLCLMLCDSGGGDGVYCLFQ